MSLTSHNFLDSGLQPTGSLMIFVSDSPPSAVRRISTVIASPISPCPFWTALLLTDPGIKTEVLSKKPHEERSVSYQSQSTDCSRNIDEMTDLIKRGQTVSETKHNEGRYSRSM